MISQMDGQILDSGVKSNQGRIIHFLKGRPLGMSCWIGAFKMDLEGTECRKDDAVVFWRDGSEIMETLDTVGVGLESRDIERQFAGLECDILPNEMGEGLVKQAAGADDDDHVAFGEKVTDADDDFPWKIGDACHCKVC